MARNDYAQGAQAYTLDYYDQYDSTIANGEARIPICFCIDTSGSMNNITGNVEVKEIPGSERYVDGRRVVSVAPKYPWQKLTTRIDELRRVLGSMLTKMKRNPVIARSAVVSIITFDQFADCQMEYTDLNRVSPDVANKIRIGDGKNYTNMGKGLTMALDRLDQFQHMNSNAGNDSYRPVLIFMSDGDPTDREHAGRLRTQVRQRSEDCKLNVIPIGIGSGIPEQYLRGLTRESRIYRMDTDKEFDHVFEEITQRIYTTTMVISTDEDEYNMANDALEDIPNTQYGTNYIPTNQSSEKSAEEYANFLNDYMNA